MRSNPVGSGLQKQVSMSKVESTELAQALGLSRDENGSWLEDRRGLSHLVRQSVFRRGVATRQEVWTDWRFSFEALGEETSQIKIAILNVGEHLANLGEFVPVKIGREFGWVKAKPRWIALCESQGVVLGAVSPIVERNLKSTIPTAFPADIVRRFSLQDESAEELYVEADEISLADWLGPGEWCKYIETQNGSKESIGLREFWARRIANLEQSQVGADPDSKTTFVLSGQGSFFGQLRSETASGRWKTPSDSDDGIYVGRRRGFNDNDWRFFLCEIANGYIKQIMPLSESNELLWTLLAKGVADGVEEKWTFEDSILSFTFPPPKQLSRLCDLLGWRVGTWRWKLADSSAIEKLNFWREA